MKHEKAVDLKLTHNISILGLQRPTVYCYIQKEEEKRSLQKFQDFLPLLNF